MNNQFYIVHKTPTTFIIYNIDIMLILLFYVIIHMVVYNIQIKHTRNILMLILLFYVIIHMVVYNIEIKHTRNISIIKYNKIIQYIIIDNFRIINEIELFHLKSFNCYHV